MKISIIEFINKRKEELEKFGADWMLQAKADPDNWPLFLERGDWNEQELITLLPED